MCIFPKMYFSRYLTGAVFLLHLVYKQQLSETSKELQKCFCLIQGTLKMNMTQLKHTQLGSNMQKYVIKINFPGNMKMSQFVKLIFIFFFSLKRIKILCGYIVNCFSQRVLNYRKKAVPFLKILSGKYMRRKYTGLYIMLHIYIAF